MLHTARCMELLHLSGRKTCDHVLRKGTSWRGRTMNIRWMPGIPQNIWQQLKEKAPQGIYLGTFAPLSLNKSAVDRNRMRRRCREALRITIREESKLPTAQLLLSPRSSSLACDFADILADVRSFLTLLRACPKPPASETPFSSSR